VVNEYPHDVDAYTQGLVFHDGELYEGTGLYGHSSLRRVELETGSVLQIHELDDKYFGEGITIYDDRIIQLTWREKLGFVYNRESLEQIDGFNYSTEGWGITYDGIKLIMSDGSATLYFLDPVTFEETGCIEINAAGHPIKLLNELEYINGEIFANIYRTDRIARIDPATGNVIAWIDLTGILRFEDTTPQTDVLNGIAYDSDTDRLFVTGKKWQKLFEIELIALD
jgi:glutamine cyclotransferase